MDRKAIIILIVCFALMFISSVLVNRLYPPQPIPLETNSLGSATNQVIGTTHGPIAARSTAGSAASAPTTGALVESDAPEKLVSIENTSARCLVTSRGGGLKLIELKKYPESVGCGFRNGSSSNKVATLNTKAPVPAFAEIGSDALQGDGNFVVTNTANGARA